MRICLPVLALVLLCPARAAHAEDRVPRVARADLPVAGTCAPLRKTDLTHVLVGRKDEFGFYRVASQRNRVLDDTQLGHILKQRAGASKRGDHSEHSVWITAARDHRWAHVVKVLLHCHAAGIHRVGLRVRSEAMDRVFGFPLFLPPAVPEGASSTGKATEMGVRIQTFAADGEARPTIPGATPIERDAPKATDLNNVYVAASRAVKRYGKVVASVRVATNATVQDAVRVLDLLYRGGCTGVRVRITTNIASPKIDVYSVVWLGDMALGGKSPLRPPPVQPRTQPWSIDGANQSGWAQLDLVPMSQAGAAAPTEKALPNFAARGSVPAFEMERADATIRNWAQGLSADLVAAARGGPQLVPHLPEADRRPEAVGGATRPVRMFADANAFNAATLLVSAYLYRGSQGVGVVDLLLFLAPTRTQLVYARWRAPGASNHPIGPLSADPYAAGTAGRLRVWVEGLCLGARNGPAALPMARVQDVLAAFPTPAHAAMSRVMEPRRAELTRLVQGLRSVRFNRVMLRTSRLDVPASRGNNVIGVLYANVSPEAGELRLSRLAGRRADR